MRITVRGGDGYCGWATALSLSQKGHAVSIVDNFSRSAVGIRAGSGETLTPIRSIRAWRRISGLEIESFVGHVGD